MLKFQDSVFLVKLHLISSHSYLLSGSFAATKTQYLWCYSGDCLHLMIRLRDSATK